jgi:hypothetical protein
MKTLLRIQYLCICVVICLFTQTTNAQVRSKSSPGFVKGLEGGLGIQSATIKSSIAELNDLSWVAEGGKILFVSGNQTLMTKCGLGFYYSASSVPQTIDLFYGELSANFYPVRLLTSREMRINPYVIAGAFYNQYKFGGTHLAENTEPRNLSVVDESYMAKINQVNVQFGAGLEYRLLYEKQFLHVFAEGALAGALLSKASEAAFEQTSTSKHFQTHIGVRFGFIRYR